MGRPPPGGTDRPPPRGGRGCAVIPLLDLRGSARRIGRARSESAVATGSSSPDRSTHGVTRDPVPSLPPSHPNPAPPSLPPSPHGDLPSSAQQRRRPLLHEMAITQCAEGVEGGGDVPPLLSGRAVRWLDWPCQQRQPLCVRDDCVAIRGFSDRRRKPRAGGHLTSVKGRGVEAEPWGRAGGHWAMARAAWACMHGHQGQ